MYGWIWRHLPFGLPGKLIGSLVLTAAVVAALWFWAFPILEPLAPFDDGQIANTGGVPGNPGESVPPDDVIPYSTEENATPPPSPSPSPSRSRR